MLHALGIHHTAFTVADLERSLAFYVGQLGFRLVLRKVLEGPAIAELVGVPGATLSLALLQAGGEEIAPLSAGAARLELIQYLTPAGRPYDRGNHDVGSGHVAVVVADLDAVYQRLQAQEVHFNCPPQLISEGDFAGWKGTYLRDPDGITVELLQPPVAR